MGGFEIYDMLINGIEPDIGVSEAFCGNIWSYVRSTEGAVGLAMTIDERTRPFSASVDYCGMTLRELARLSKSWNFAEAALGVAAINAYYNAPKRLGDAVLFPSGGEQDAFIAERDAVHGKKVAAIGSFPKVFSTYEGICELSVIEKKPSKGEYPDSAAEFLLPGQDFVFITASTLVNKTLPRLLELSKNAKTILLGTSAPLCAGLFDFAVDCVGAYVPDDLDFVKHIAASGNFVPLGKAGRRVRLTKEA